jgi:hypothetical protein
MVKSLSITNVDASVIVLPASDESNVITSPEAAAAIA